MTLLYKDRYNWRAQEDAIASDLVNDLKGSGIVYFFYCIFTLKIEKLGQKSRGTMTKTSKINSMANVIQNLITSFDFRALMRPRLIKVN